jgi:DnaJ-class molecular chaperone
MARDPYKVLGVDADATEEEIRRAHRKLVKKLHPDAGSGSSEADFRDVQEAYGTLSDPEKRDTYDRSHGAGDNHAGHWGPPWQRRGPHPEGYHLDLRNLRAAPRAEPFPASRRRETFSARHEDPFDVFSRYFDVWLSDDGW